MGSNTQSPIFNKHKKAVPLITTQNLDNQLSIPSEKRSDLNSPHGKGEHLLVERGPKLFE